MRLGVPAVVLARSGLGKDGETNPKETFWVVCAVCRYTCHKACHTCTVDVCAVVREAKDKEKDYQPIFLMADNEDEKFRWLMHLQVLRVTAVHGRMPPVLEADQL